MKYLLIILISFNCYANFNVKPITNKDGRKFCYPNGCKRATFLEASTWASEQKNDGSWGDMSGIEFEIEDISAEVDQEAADKQIRTDDIIAIRAMISNINNDDTLKPYLKRLLRQYVKDLRE